MKISFSTLMTCFLGLTILQTTFAAPSAPEFSISTLLPTHQAVNVLHARARPGSTSSSDDEPPRTGSGGGVMRSGGAHGRSELALVLSIAAVVFVLGIV
ncbi:hypothetical protein Vi05172_g11763 [Venturia inaequalis]|nr:hypothetical protein Vi05172_g11763 [Venturia inaequalis]